MKVIKYALGIVKNSGGIYEYLCYDRDAGFFTSDDIEADKIEYFDSVEEIRTAIRSYLKYGWPLDKYKFKVVKVTMQYKFEDIINREDFIF